MRVQPPCKVNGVECDRRYVGCRADCDKWNEYLVAHEAEKEQIRRNRDKYMAAEDFLITQSLRVRQARHRDYMREYNKRRR